ncbi:MAG: omptin family outer membrane protease [Thermodesulfobacteriota bacterium]|nr:omptin family outer membrane protease [Thermodesulfobacteriota bacterium]
MYKLKGYQRLYAAVAIFFLFFSAPAIAVEASLSSGTKIDHTAFNEEIEIGPRLIFMLGGEKWEGDTTYQIGGTVSIPGATYEYHFPISELAFPLDVYMISMSCSIEITPDLFWSAGVKKNVTDDSGKMEDSDWMTSSNPNQLDIYSESDAELDATIIDFNLRYRFFKKSGWSFNAGFGYLYQQFDYDIYDLDQWYPSGIYGTGHDYVSGKVLTYEVSYSIPYIEIGAQFKIKDISVETTLGYSPFVNVIDEDHHILRSKVNEGHCRGDARFLSFKGEYAFLNNWFLTLALEYMKIETEGESSAYFYGMYDHTIDEEIFSEQKVITFAVGYVF